jgi:hypothetical protein
MLKRLTALGKFASEFMWGIPFYRWCRNVFIKLTSTGQHYLSQAKDERRTGLAAKNCRHWRFPRRHCRREFPFTAANSDGLGNIGLSHWTPGHFPWRVKLPGVRQGKIVEQGASSGCNATWWVNKTHSLINPSSVLPLTHKMVWC